MQNNCQSIVKLIRKYKLRQTTRAALVPFFVSFINVLSVVAQSSTISTPLKSGGSPVNSDTKSSKDNTGRAKLVGTVSDAKTGEKLIGVTIALEGTKAGAKTNGSGLFQLQTDPDTYNVRVSYVGYNTKIVEGVTLGAGETRSLDFVLEQAAVRGQEVVVTAKIATESATAQLLARKNASTMNDVLGAEQIRRAPDATSGDAIRRMSSVTIRDNKFVTIRGTSERYNNTLLNGSGVTSTEPDKKAFSFDLLPSNLIDNTVVTKTFTPDLPANFSGGLVQINTVGLPDAFTAKLSYSASYNAQTTGSGFSTSERSSTDWLGFDDGLRAIPRGMPAENIRDAKVTQEEITRYGQLFRNNWTPRSITAPMASSVSASLGDTYDVGDEGAFGYIATLSYRNSYDHTDIVRNYFDGLGDTMYARNGNRDVSSVLWGGLLNLTYEIAPMHTVSFKNLYNRSADDEIVQLSGFNVESMSQRLTSLRYTERSLYSGQLTGEHRFEELGNIKLDWRAARANSIRREPDLRKYIYTRSRDAEPTDPWYLAISAPDPQNAGRFFSDLNEMNYEGAMDVTVPYRAGNIKIGGLATSKIREFDARVLAYRLTGSPAFIYRGIDSVFLEENIGAGFNKLELSELTNPSDSYDALENIRSAYAMIDLPLEVLGEKFRAVTGVRLEHAVQQINSGLVQGGIVAYDRRHADLLPALNLIYQATDRTNIRASASRTLTRPEFREVAPFAFYDFELGTLVQGDTSIDRATVWNLDARYEFFPTAAEVVSVSVFHKLFHGAIEATDLGQNSIKSWSNAPKPAVNYGAEIELRKNLGFLGDYFSNLTFSGNYSYIFSRVDVSEISAGQRDARPMQGQSPFTVNLGLLFTEPTLGTTVNVLYNTYGKRIAAVGANGQDMYEFPRDVLDLTISQPFLERYEVRYAAKDIAGSLQTFRNGSHVWDKLERSNSKAPTHSLSLSVKF